MPVLPQRTFHISFSVSSLCDNISRVFWLAHSTHSTREQRKNKWIPSAFQWTCHMCQYIYRSVSLFVCERVPVFCLLLFITPSAAQTSSELQDHLSRCDWSQLHLSVAASGRDSVERGEGQPHHGPTCDHTAPTGRRDHSGHQYTDCPIGAAKRRVRQMFGAPQRARVTDCCIHEH